MTAEATETRVTAYFMLEGGLVHQFALDIGIFLLRHINGIAGGGTLNSPLRYSCLTGIEFTELT